MMGKRKTERLTFADREGRILTAAVAIFTECGFRGGTTKAIAEQAGVNEALLFRHYPNKEALYTAALRQIIGDKDVRFLPKLTFLAKQPLRTALLKLARRIISENRKHPELMRMLLFSGLEGHHLAGDFIGEGLPLQDRLTKFFRERMAGGEVRRGDPGHYARTFLALVFFYFLTVDVLQAKRYYGGTETETLTETVELFLEGVKS